MHFTRQPPSSGRQQCGLLHTTCAWCSRLRSSALAAKATRPNPPSRRHRALARLVSERLVETERFSEVFDNPCNSTSVQITGQIVHTFHGVTDIPGSGRFLHWKDSYRVSGTGLGDDGTKYVFNDTDIESFQSPSPSAPQSTYISFDGIRLVSKGVSPNFMVHGRFHITFRPGWHLQSHVRVRKRGMPRLKTAARDASVTPNVGADRRRRGAWSVRPRGRTGR